MGNNKIYRKSKKRIRNVMIIILLMSYIVASSFSQENDRIFVTFYGVDQRVDISYSYKKIPDGEYKIYLSDISHISYDESVIRLECTAGGIVNADETLQKKGENYLEYNTIGEIYLMEFNPSIAIDNIIDMWKDIREKIEIDPNSPEQPALYMQISNEEIQVLRLI